MRFHFAEEYVQRGFSVIPLVGKIPPAGFRWSRYQRHRALLREIRDWFGPGQKTVYNVGLVTGSVSGVTVIDIDTYEDTVWWRNRFPVPPLVAMTGRGGAHLYYRCPPNTSVRNRVRILGRRIDVRGEGGYVVAPPSVHPETGKRYVWCPWTNYSLDEIPRLDPSWLGLEFSAEPGDGPSSLPERPIQNGPAYIAHIDAISGSGGHNSTFRAACALRDAGMTAAAAFEALLVWNETNCSPKWTEKELAHKVHDAFHDQGAAPRAR